MTLESLLRKITLLTTLLLSSLVGLALFESFNSKSIQTILWAAAIMSILFIIKNFIVDQKRISAKSQDIAAICITILFCTIALVFHHDYSKGRDDMVHLVSAHNLAKHESLLFTDSLGHTFTGFVEVGENLFTSRFLPAYITSLAPFTSTESPGSAHIANALILFFGFMAIYFTTKRLKNSNAGLIALSWFGTLYSTVWFSKRLNSELLFFALFWISIWFLLSSFQQKKQVWLTLSFIPLTLLLLTRGEAFLFIISFIFFGGLYAWHYSKNNNHSFFRKRYFIFTIPSLANVFYFVYYISQYNSYYFASQTENILNGLSSISPTQIILGITSLILLGIIGFIFKFKFNLIIKSKKQKGIALGILFSLLVIFLANKYFISIDNLSWKIYRLPFAIEVFVLYFYFIYILFILKGLLKRNFNKKHFYLLGIISPSLVFLFEHNIAPDQPWFMRRFFAVLLPFLIILASIAFSKSKQIIELKVLQFVAVLAINIIIALPVLFFVDNNGASTQIKTLAQKVSNNDIVLMQPGWDWQKWAYSLHFIHEKTAIPNLNIQKIDTKITIQLIEESRKHPNWKTSTDDLLAIKHFHEKHQLNQLEPYLNNSENVYVLSKSAFDYPFFDVSNLELIENTVITYPTLRPSTNILDHINKPGNIDINYIRSKQKNTPPRVIQNEKIDLLLLKVIDPSKTKLSSELSDEEIVQYRNFLSEIIPK